MHILFFSHYFPPEVNAPATRTYEHCRRWIAAGHQVTVVTCAPNCPNGVVFDGYRNSWRSEECVEGIRVIRVWTYLAANQGFLRRIANYVSYMVSATLCAVWLKKIDVVVATSPQFFCGWAGVLCRWIRRWPLVLEIRDIWPESIVTVGAMKRSRIIRFLEWLERRMYRAASHIVTVGSGYRRQLLERGVPADKVSVIPNGVGDVPPAPRDRKREIRERWGADGRFVCGYVGTVGMAHGLEVVLKAAARLKDAGRDDIAFWIVGDGAQRRALEEEAANQGLSNVVFTGLVPKEAVGNVIASLDACLVHLHGTELFQTVIPSKIFEIMAARVPIVMGVRGESRDIVLKANAGVAMVPDDPESLIECLDEIARNPDVFRHGADYVRQHYCRDNLAGRMLAVCEREAGIPVDDMALPIDDSHPITQREGRRAA